MTATPRSCSRIPDNQESGDEANGGEEGFGQFVVARSDAAKLFEFVEKALDAVTTPIKGFVAGRFLAAGADGRDDRFDSVQGQALANALGVVALVESGELRDVVRVEAFVKSFKLPAIVGLAGAQVEGERTVFVEGRRVDFGGEASARAPQSLLRPVFFGAPAAC
jgi:hypothetical protein